MDLRAIFRPGMRAYFFPLTAGIALAVSAFLPWVVIGEVTLGGVPEMAALWALGLGLLAAALAFLSLITRRNSRHPLLVVGLVALGVMFLSWRIMPRAAGERAELRSQAYAIVEHTEAAEPPEAFTGAGIYLGLAASAVIVLFGLTIVVKRVANPYAIDSVDDDVD
jgi:steroid 5-alpha reductase family enzyme